MDRAIDVHRDPSRDRRQQSMDRYSIGVAVAFVPGAMEFRTSHHFTSSICAVLSEMCDQIHQMPQDPNLFTNEIVDAKALRRRMDIWIDKTFYVLRKMNEQGYCRMAKPEALEMMEKMAERISGMTVAYRHLLDAHVIASFINHLVRQRLCRVRSTRCAFVQVFGYADLHGSLNSNARPAFRRSLFQGVSSRRQHDASRSVADPLFL